MTKLLAALSLPQVGSITISGEIEDQHGKGVIIQLEVKGREYTLRALNKKEAKKWVEVLTALRDGEATGEPSERKDNASISSAKSSLSVEQVKVETSADASSGWAKTDRSQECCGQQCTIS